MEAKTRRQFLKGISGVALGVAGVVGVSGFSRSAEDNGAAVAGKSDTGTVPCCKRD